MLEWFKTKKGTLAESEFHEVNTIEISYQNKNIFIPIGIYTRGHNGEIIRLPNITLPHYLIDELRNLYKNEISPIIV